MTVERPEGLGESEEHSRQRGKYMKGPGAGWRTGKWKTEKKDGVAETEKKQ